MLLNNFCCFSLVSLCLMILAFAVAIFAVAFAIMVYYYTGKFTVFLYNPEKESISIFFDFHFLFKIGAIDLDV